MYRRKENSELVFKADLNLGEEMDNIRCYGKTGRVS
jgi:hypothetical protein